MVLGVHGQVFLDCIVDQVEVLGHAGSRQVRAVAIEQVVAVGAMPVPVDNAYILVARGGVGDGLVRGPDPRLRATCVYKHDNTLLAGVGHDRVDLGVRYQTVGAQGKDHDLTGKVLLDIALKCRAARIKLAALFGIDMAVREHAVKGINGAQRHGVTDHQQVVGAIGEAVVVLVGVVDRLLVGGRGVFGFLVQNFGALAAQRRRLGHKDQTAQCNDQHDSAGCADRDVRACPVGGCGGAIAEFGDGAAEGTLPKWRFDKAIGTLGYGDHQQHLQNVLPPGRIVDVGDRVHEQQQRIVPQVDAVRAFANPHERLGGQRTGNHSLGLHAGRDDHEREDGA